MDTNQDIVDFMKMQLKRENILVTGNGFDLHHYLPTRYIDFMNVVKRLLALDKLNKLGDCLYLNYIFGPDSPVYEENPYIQQCYRIHKDTMKSTRLDAEVLRKIVEIGNNNIWISYFLNSKEKDTGWIDFEKMIAKVIGIFEQLINQYFDLSGIELKTNIDTLTLEEFHILLQFPKIFENINGNLYWQEEYFEYDEDDDPIRLNEEKLVSDMTLELERLTEALSFYIEEFVQKIAANKRSECTLFADKDIVINFNYTNTFTSLYNSQAVVYYVHGSSQEGNIVLGINDNEHDQLEHIDLKFIGFKKYFQRIKKRTEYNYMNFIRKEKEYHLHFVGHSLDVTDRDIIVALLEHENTKSTIYYHSEEVYAQLIINLIALLGKDEFECLLFSEKIKFEELGKFEKK